jgi:16S rRNA processing protein RimM
VPGKLGVRKGRCTLFFLKTPAKSGVFFYSLNIMKKPQNIHIGHCVSPHGIQGEFSFVFYNTDSNVIKKKSELFISPISNKSSLNNELSKVIVSNIRYGNKIIASLEGITTRNQVEDMIPFNIYYPREKLPKLKGNEFYLHDLLGCKVISFFTKEEVGIVENFYENGEQLILQIGSLDKKIEILFIEQFVPAIDIENKIIEVIIPEIVE